MKTKLLFRLVFIITFLLFSNQLSAQELWGMTHLGGNSNLGTIFKYDLGSGVYTKIFDFDGTNGSKPYGSLFFASNNMLYGMTQLGGINDKGVIFKYNPTSNTFTKLLDFDGTNNGSKPRGNLMEFNSGVLYGTTEFGGLNDIGVLFEYNISTNTYTKKVDFDTNLGKYPNFGSLIKASNNLIYGTAIQGGAGDGGTLFEYNPSSNTFVKKIDIGTVQVQSSYPRNTLLQASNGLIYGGTDIGSGGLGTVGLFKYDISTNTYSNRVSLSANALNGGFIQTSDGKIHILSKQGGVNSTGAIFEYDLTSNNLTKKFDFDLDGVNTGRLPSGNFMLANDGKLYGLTSRGGSDDKGVLFEYNPTTNTLTKKLDFVYISGSLLKGWEPTGNLIEVVIPETVAISDANFEQALIDLGLDTNGLNGNILKSEALAVTSLDVSDPIANPALPNVLAKITDLTGISGFVNLQSLNVNTNSLSAIDLSLNTHLTSLDVGNNLLTGLDVANNTLLTSILANNNNMINIDISLNTNLTSLNLATNNLERVNLRNANNTAISTFDIRNNASLTCVLVDNPTWSDGNWVNHDSGTIYSLDCNDIWSVYTPDANLLGALSALSGLDANLDGNISINEAAAFSGILNLSGLGIVDPSGLEAFTGVTQINLSNNSLTDLSSLINSTVVIVSSKTTGELSHRIRNFEGLTSLNASHNQLTSLDVSKMVLLTDLDVSFNNLTDLNIKNSNNSNLTSFNALSNSLSCIEADSNIIGFIPLGWQVDSSVSFSANCAATLNVDSNFLNNHLSIYPNPSQGLIYINKILDVKINNLSLYNIVGSLVKQFKPSQTELNITTLPSGLYILKIETNQGNISKKIIKE